MGSYTPGTTPLAEDSGLDFPEPTQTLHQILTESARQHPERIALVSCDQPWDLLPSPGHAQETEKGGYLRWSYAQLESTSDILASYFTKNGISKGNPVVVVLYSCAEWALCFWAAAKLGCPFVPINPAIVSRATEIQHILSALGKVGALVVNDESIAKLLSKNASPELYTSSINLILGGNASTAWTRFNDVFVTPDLPKLSAAEQKMEDVVLIVLISGTTALPKGCPQSNKTVASMCTRHRIMYSLDERRISCNHMPLFHFAGVMESLWAWAHGGTVVYPNRSFDARATLDAIDSEHCTDMCLVPSMLRAMVDHPVLPARSTDSLGLIKLAANDVMGSDARACSETLRAKIVTNCFGMTETSGMTEIFAWTDGVCKDSEPFPAGRMAPGAKARICAPGSRDPLRRGEIGELHQGGKTITDRYIGGDDDVSSFYTDQAGSWHVSGDRAVMAVTGEISVLGRYKDIINRAGENISPSTMERVLDGTEGVQSSQVVGVPDEVAGEVPVAVIKMIKDSSVSKALLYDRIVKELGVAFALERVIDFKDLAIDDFPTTATGKVRKKDVRQLVLDHLQYESKASTRMSAREPTEAALARIWARFSGVAENQISLTRSLEGMVDSVTVMRFRSQVKKELGKTLSLEELNRNPTIVKQAALLDRQQDTALQGSSAMSERVRDGPPGLSDLVHARGNQAAFDQVRREAEKKLHALGLSWDKDVEEVLPIYDFLQYWGATTDSMIFRIAFACANASTSQLRSAMEIVLPQHGMLRTILVDSPLTGPSWVMIRPSSHWFNLTIKDGGAVNEPEDLLTTDLTNLEAGPSKPIPLFYLNLDYFTSRLRGIAQRRGGLWPPETFQSVNGTPARTPDQLLLKGNITPGLAGIAKHIKLDMGNNQYLKVHKIPHSVAIKAAIAIFNTQQTDHPYAFFSNLQMCRSYPFIERQIADRLPDPMDMPGATIEVSFDNIHLGPTEPVSTLLHRMHADQKEDTARAQFPMLGLRDQLGEEDGAFLAEVLRRQAVNYNPVVTQDPNATLQNLQFAGNANLSFMWWCGMVDAETVQMRVTWNDEVFGPKDAEMAMDGFERNMKWLVNGENWDKPIGECDR
ncbi:MAG: hypothetical protein Q9191_006136 [Dirinaria sp. TL-2023a]